MTTRQALRCLSRGQRVIVTDNLGREVEGELLTGLEWITVAGSPATKHCSISTAKYGWGYKVRSPIIQADGSLYRVRGQISMGIGYVAEEKVRAA